MNRNFKLAERVEQSIVEKKLFAHGAFILVAVSGGLDSMVLLEILAGLAKSHDWQLTVAHFNHQLRGRSSDADERLVQRTAKKLALPFVADRADVQAFASKNKLSLEMAARKLRHDFLARTAAKFGIGSIALAHHADDQVELFFVRLLRGAGGAGWAGMKWLGPSPAVAKILLARPLLDQPKNVLATYARQKKIIFREDATNAQLDIQRNRIRHELLPLLTKKYQPALTRVVLRQMEIVGAEAHFVTGAALSWLEGKRRPAFDDLPLALQRRCLQLQLAQHSLATNFDLVEQLRETANRPVSVDENLAVIRDARGCVTIENKGGYVFNDKLIKIQLKGRVGEIVFGDTRIHWQREASPSDRFCVPKKRLNFECFDADTIGGNIVLRHWQSGDRFQPIGMGKPVKLQDLFTNGKVHRSQRHRLLVAATASGEIFWVEGLRLGERFKLDKKTRYQLNWRWKRVS